MRRLRLTGLAIVLIISARGFGQFVKKMTLELPNTNITKSAADSLLLVSPDFPMTGLVVKIDTSGSFKNSYIIAENDTFYLMSDNHVRDTTGYLTSNLIVFRNKLSEFLFRPGNIRKEVEFAFINASPTKKDLRKERRKKKRCRLFRTRND
jgi:hypothetical protein